MPSHLTLILKTRITKNSPIPLYQQITNVLEKAIIEGDFLPSARLPTENELENELGISRVTIRQAMNEAVKMGLVVRNAGKGTFVADRSQESRKVGFISYIVHHLTSSFNTQMLLAVESTLKNSGHHLIFGSSEGDLEKENLLLNNLNNKDTLGVLIQPVYSEKTERALTHLAQSSMPLVLIDREVPGLNASQVTSDHFGGGQVVVQHLIDQGYRNIVYLTGHVNMVSSVMGRYSGYQAAMQQAGFPPQPAVVLKSMGEIGYNRSVRVTSDQEEMILQEICQFLTKPGWPEAIVATNDAVALLVLRAANRLKLRVPEDLALTGYDELDFASSWNLTSVDQHADQIGAQAANLLLKQIRGESHQMERISLPTQLVVRGSSQRLHDHKSGQTG